METMLTCWRIIKEANINGPNTHTHTLNTHAHKAINNIKQNARLNHWAIYSKAYLKKKKNWLTHKNA